MRHGRMVALLACVLTCVLGSVAVAAPAYTVEMVQVVHRHGARSALVTYNESKICGTLFPCGYLNYEGQQMLLKFGSFLRERYTSDPSVVSTPFLTSDSYNLSVSMTRSTDVLRTLQSADAFLKGLFPNTSAFYPAIHTARNEEDHLLHSSLVPIISARYNYADAEIRAMCDPVLDKRMTFAQLQAVAAEVYSDGYCANYTLRSRCAEVLCDIAHAYQSTGQIDSTPLLREHLDNVCAVTATSSHYYFGFNQSNPIHKKQGAPYYHLSTTLLNNMVLHQDRATAPPFKLYEYSAHDTTISPLAASLGDSSLEAMLPPFGTAFIFELLTLGGTSSSVSPSWYVRVLRGHPGVTPSTNFTFALTTFLLRCMDSTGKTYIATNNVCPLADFQRYVNSTAPTDPSGACYIDPTLKARMNCPADAAAANGSLSAECLVYRKTCGAYACGSEFYLSAVDYGCYRIPTAAGSSASSGLSKGGIAALSICLFIAGAVAGVAAIEVRKRFMKPTSDGQALIELQER